MLELRSECGPIFLVLFVAVVGSLLLPANRLAQVVKRRANRTTYAHYRVSSIQSGSETDVRLRVQRETTVGEIKEQTDHNPSAGAGDFGFRPLTEEEKKAFLNSLDARGSQILAELAGEATSTSDPEPLNTTSPPTAPYRVSVNIRDYGSMAGNGDL